MKIVKCANCIIEVDVEKTKEYYRGFKVSDTQGNRNYQKYCETMIAEEREFFDNFGVDPVCCNVVHFGISKKKTLCCDGEYVICGRYVEYPQTEDIPLEDFIENGLETDEPTPSTVVGGFWFSFKDKEEDWEKEDPDESYVDIPEGFIKFSFEYEKLPWLLKEKCEKKEWKPPHFWEIHRKLKERNEEKQALIEAEQETAKWIENLFNENSIKAEFLTKKETDRLKRDWIEAFSPVGANKKGIKENCYKNRRYNTYLWHLFSFGYAEAQEEKADELYNEQDKTCCYILNSCEDLAYRIENGERLDADFLEQFVDVVITATDFSWTYAKTHEDHLGPYYYKR